MLEVELSNAEVEDKVLLELVLYVAMLLVDELLLDVGNPVSLNDFVKVPVALSGVINISPIRTPLIS